VDVVWAWEISTGADEGIVVEHVKDAGYRDEDVILTNLRLLVSRLVSVVAITIAVPVAAATTAAATAVVGAVSAPVVTPVVIPGCAPVVAAVIAGITAAVIPGLAPVVTTAVVPAIAPSIVAAHALRARRCLIDGAGLNRLRLGLSLDGGRLTTTGCRTDSRRRGRTL